MNALEALQECVRRKWICPFARMNGSWHTVGTGNTVRGAGESWDEAFADADRREHRIRPAEMVIEPPTHMGKLA